MQRRSLLLVALVACVALMGVGVAAEGVSKSLGLGSSSSLSGRSDADVDKWLPASGQASLALIVVFSIVAICSVVFFLGRHRYVPVAGSRLVVQQNGTQLNYTVGWRRYFPAVMVFISFILKIVGMGVDRWTESNSDEVRLLWGVLGVHHEEAWGGFSGYNTYEKMCKSMYEGSGRTVTGNVQMCRVVRAAGLLTLLSGIFSLLFSFVLFFMALSTMKSQSLLAQRGVKMWRVSGLAHLASFGAFFYWIGAHIIILRWAHDDDMDNMFNQASCWLFLVSLILDSWVTGFTRRAVRATPPEVGANGYMHMGGVAIVAGTPVPYQQLPVAYPPQQQQHHQQQHPAAPYGYAAPQGYGAPAPQGYGQPAYGQPMPYGQPVQAYGQPVAYGQPQQQQPAFNPYSSQPQQPQQQFQGQPQQFQSQPQQQQQQYQPPQAR